MTRISQAQIQVGGKTYSLENGSDIRIDGVNVFVNGALLSPSESETKTSVEIHIHGFVENLQVSNVASLTVQEAGAISASTSNVNCDVVKGDIVSKLSNVAVRLAQGDVHTD